MQISDLLPPQSVDIDPLLEFEAGLEQAARALDLDSSVLQRVKHPEREITINIPAVRSDGAAVNVTAYRVQHSRVGPCIGPVMVSPVVHPAQLRMQAVTITLQSALVGLPLGGAAGAIVCDPNDFGEHELRRVVHEYVSALRDDTGADVDILVPQGPSWMARTMEQAKRALRGRGEPAAVIRVEDVCAAEVAALVALIGRVLQREPVSGLRIAVQGFNRRARWLAESLPAAGAKVVGIADRSGAVLRRDGIDISALAAYAADRGVVFGFPNAEPATNTDLIECECDLLVLAAAERQVGSHNARHIQARAILELTPNAVAIAPQDLPASCTIIPHLLSGTAEVAVWTYAWRQALGYQEVDPRIAGKFATEKVLSALETVHAGAGIPLLQAVRTAAVEKFANCLLR